MEVLTSLVTMVLSGTPGLWLLALLRAEVEWGRRPQPFAAAQCLTPCTDDPALASPVLSMQLAQGL